MVQAITIPPPKGVGPLQARQRAADTLRVGSHGRGASKGRSARRLLLQPSPGGVRFALATPPDRALMITLQRPGCAFAGAAIVWRFVPHPHAMALLAPAHNCAHEPSGLSRPANAGSAVRDRVSTTASLRPSLSSASIHSPSARSASGGGNGGPQGARQAPPSVRAQNSAPTAVGACFAPRVRGVTPLALKARHPFFKSAVGGPATLFPPISFPPLEPPLPDPPFKLEHAKGGKPQGATARRLHRRG